MAVSILFTASLLAFAGWHAIVGPAVAPPDVRVIGNHPGPNGSVVYTVELTNPGDLGLVSATVEVGCTDPPVELVFENVAANGRRVGTVVCPPGTTDPDVSLSNWIQE